MDHAMNRRSFLKGIGVAGAAAAIGAAGAGSAAADEAAGATYADGTYTAAGAGMGGDVPVTVTIEGGAIAGVEIGENAETQGIGSNAIEQLPPLIVEAGGITGVNTVSGATITSKAIFSAVEDCLAQASGGGTATSESAGDTSGELVLDADTYQNAKWTFEIAPDPVDENLIEETEDCEILIIGAGMGGIVTAASAIEEGADVIVIAESSAPVSRGGSNAAFNTRLTEELGMNYTREEIEPIFQSIFAANSFRLDQEKWWLIYNESGTAMNWLMDKLAPYGISTVIENNQQDNGGPLATLNVSHSFVTEENQAAGASQQVAIEALANEAEKAGVRFYYNTTAVQLDRADNNTGRVTGCVATRDGKYIRYNASKGVVLATGDFSRDRDMVAKYCPIALPFGQGGVYDGSGLKMAMWIGAAKSTHPTPQCSPQWATRCSPAAGGPRARSPRSRACS